MSFLYLVADIYPNPENRVEALEAYRVLIEKSLAEPGCVYYDLVIDPKTPDVWHMLEKWESKAHWDEHMKTDHVKAISLLEPDLTLKPTVLNFFEAAS